MGEVAFTLITIVFTAIVTNSVARYFKKDEIEKIRAEKAAIDQKQIQAVIDMWQGLVEDLTADVKELTSEVEMLRKENKELKEQMQGQSIENRSLKAEMKKLEKLLHGKTN